MYGALRGIAADIGGDRGAVVQLFTNFKGKIMTLLKSTVQHCNSVWSNHKHLPGQPNVPAAGYTHIDSVSFAAQKPNRQIFHHLQPVVPRPSRLHLCA